MSFKFQFCKLIAFVITIAQLLSLLPIITFADSSEEALQPEETIVQEENTLTDNIIQVDDMTLKTEHKLTAIINEKQYTEKEQIPITFDNTDIVDYYYVADGVTVTEKNTDSMQFEITAIDEFGSIDVYADYGEGELVKSSVYTYQKDGVVYVSDVSKDLAFHDCMKAQYDAGLISMAEWEAAYSDLSRLFMKPIDVPKETNTSLTSITSETVNYETSSTSATTITVNGRLYWELKNGVQLPLRQTKVDLRDQEPAKTSRWIATTYTNNQGYFSFTVDNPDKWYELENGGLDVFVRVHIESNTFKVARVWGDESYYIDSPTVENVSTGSTIPFNYCVNYDESLDVLKAIHVQQGMVVGQRFATEMGMSTDNFIHILFPLDCSLFPDVADAAFCWGEVADNCFSVIGANRFDDFDTLIHEYGHFVEISKETYGASLLEILINWPDHKSDDDQFEKKNEKDYAMELTWSESWATAFSQIAQEYYKSEYSNIPNFADRTDGENYEQYTYETASGEAQEDAVIAFLWDLYDSGSNESYDNIALGYRSWWNYTTKKGTYTLTDFVNAVNHYYPNNRSTIGEILGAHQISPSKVRIRNKSSVSESTPPQLSWRVNGSQANPNNQFKVTFYDAYGNYIYATSYITSTAAYDSPFLYTVSLSDWKRVLKNYGGTFIINIVVSGYHTEEPISGPYPSKYTPIELTIHKDLETLPNNKYTEYLLKLDKKGYCDFTVTFAASGSKLIQTFGTKDTVIELYDYDGTLLASNDDGGYNRNAFIQHTFWVKREYTIRVKFYKDSIYGTTKLSIIPAYGALNSNSTKLSTYEDIYAIKNSTNFTWNSFAEQNYTRVITYTPPSTGKYTFEIQSDFDTYIYVIDPRSTSTIVKNVNYNDDDGEGLNPLLTTSLSADIPYLIIYSAFNPKLLTQKSDLTVKIRKA